MSDVVNVLYERHEVLGGVGVLRAHGLTVPSAVPGYARGCIFVHDDGADGSSLYINNGSHTSCSFTPVPADATMTILAALSTLTATAAELNRTADPSGRIVTTTATALSLTLTEHAERVVLIDTDSTVDNTFTLPVATGSGAKFTVVNNILQTQGTVVVAANGTDVMQGVCIAVDSTAGGGGDTFLTTATSDKVSMNLTTTGGLGGDMVEAWDKSANTWYVRVLTCGSGTLATPFSAT